MTNKLTRLPPEIGQLQQLRVLNLENNQLTALPPEIGQLQKLQELSLQKNQLTTLPPEIGQLRQLGYLNLSLNKLMALPPEICQLTQLAEEDGPRLELDENPLTNPPLEIARQGYEAVCAYFYAPEIIKQLSRRINKAISQVAKIKLDTVGYQLDANGQVIALSLYKCELEKLPPEIGQLQQLQKLYLFDNQLTTLPPEIGQLQQLQQLDLFGNQLTTLPPEIGQLRQLQQLNLGSNAFTDLASEIIKLQQLQQLQKLDLSYNPLKALPSEIGQLRSLQVLGLNDNKLTALPPEICQLTQLAGKDEYGRPGLRLAENPLTDPPLEIAQQGFEAICAYFAAKNAKKPLRECKVILLGDGASGKTSLMKRLQNQPFNPNESQTHGINIAPWPVTLADGDATLYLWDFGGQQIMHATHQWFLSKRSLYLLLVDSRREMQVEYWLEHLKTFANQAPVIIVINKIDEHAHFDLPRATLQAKYPNIVDFVKISCKSGVGLQELRQAMARRYPKLNS